MHLQVAMAVIAPQSEWPQITTSVTPSAATAYSTVAVTPPGSGPKEGTMLPALRMTNKSPGSRCVTSSGTMRLFEQEMNNVVGSCLVASFWKSSLRVGNTSRWNRRNPSTTSRIESPTDGEFYQGAGAAFKHE